MILERFFIFNIRKNIRLFFYHITLYNLGKYYLPFLIKKRTINESIS